MNYVKLHSYGTTEVGYDFDKKSYTTVNGKKVLGDLIGNNWKKNLKKYREQALNNPHTIKNFEKLDFTGWCKPCFNRCCDALNIPQEKI